MCDIYIYLPDEKDILSLLIFPLKFFLFNDDKRQEASTLLTLKKIRKHKNTHSNILILTLVDNYR